ncbi:MAG TPA: MarR family transcriptional regulator [Pseudolysinimonas sp.]
MENPSGVPPRYSALVREISLLDERFRGALAHSLALDPTALDAMDWLMREGPLSPGELAGRLGLTPGAVTGVLNRLEATGHAHRESDPADRRSLRIVPTPASIDTATDRLMPLILQLSARTARYSPDEMALIERFLDDVAESYRAGIESLEADGAPSPDAA